MYVTAVVVSHNGSAFLTEVLSSLKDQTRKPDRIIAYDVGSTDNSLALLKSGLEGFEQAEIFAGTHRGSFGAALKSALSQAKPSQLKTVDGEDVHREKAVEYLWLIHDDSAPDPNALAELLSAVERASSVTIAGCKQVDWDRPSHLLDVGLSASRRGERLTMIELDEQDQRQYDGRSDTLSVNSAGMLIKRATWDELGGFDPALPGVGDDVDLGWRNWLAGQRVVVVPTARMRHVLGRPGSLSNAPAARRAQVHTQLKHASGGAYLWIWIATFFGAFGRLLAGFLFKEPGYGWRQFTSTMAGLFRWGAIARARSEASRSRKLKRSVINRLQIDPADVRTYRRALGQAMLGVDEGPSDQLEGGRDEFEPTGDAADDFASIATSRRLWVGTGAIAAVIIAAAVSLISLNRLIGANAVSGGAALPLPRGLGAIWQNATSWWVQLGAGSPGYGHPFDFVLWLISALGWGNGSLALVWLILLAAPLAALGAWACMSALSPSRWPRFLAAVIWGTAPLLVISIAQGRIGSVIALILLPWVLFAATRTVGAARSARKDDSSASLLAKPGRDGRVSFTAAAAGGLTLAVVTASAPSLLPVAVLAVVIAALVSGRRGRALWWMLVPSVVLFAPYAFANLAGGVGWGNWRALLADPGTPLGSTPAPLWLQILGQPSQIADLSLIPGMGWLPSSFPWMLVLAVMIGAPVLILALGSVLWLHKHAGAARVLWLLAILGLAAAWAINFISVERAGDALVAAFNGPALGLAILALLCSAVLGFDALQSGAARDSLNALTRGHSISGVTARLIGVLISIMLLISMVASSGAWLVQNLGQAAPAQLQASGESVLPATAIDAGVSDAQSRTLVISSGSDGATSAQLMRKSGTTLDALNPGIAAVGVGPGNEPKKSDAADGQIRSAVATIVAGSGADPRPSLGALGVGFVVLRQGDTSAQLLANQIDAVPGLNSVGLTDAGWLWRVEPVESLANSGSALASGAARILDSSGSPLLNLPSQNLTVKTQVPSGPQGRTVVLAERSASGWQAFINGKPLETTTAPGAASWAQAFKLPEGGGELEVRYEQPWAVWFFIGQILFLGLTVLMAIPMPANRGRTRSAAWSASYGGHHHGGKARSAVNAGQRNRKAVKRG